MNILVKTYLDYAEDLEKLEIMLDEIVQVLKKNGYGSDDEEGDVLRSLVVVEQIEVNSEEDFIREALSNSAMIIIPLNKND